MGIVKTLGELLIDQSMQQPEATDSLSLSDAFRWLLIVDCRLLPLSHRYGEGGAEHCTRTKWMTRATLHSDEEGIVD